MRIFHLQMQLDRPAVKYLPDFPYPDISLYLTKDPSHTFEAGELPQLVPWLSGRRKFFHFEIAK
jgi:hypothetical protein